MPSESQFLGMQFAAVMLVRLLVRVERYTADAAVYVSTASDHFDVTTEDVIILPTRRLVFTCRTLGICHGTLRCARFFAGLAPRRHHLGLPGVELAGEVLLGLLIGVHLDATQTAVQSLTSLGGLRQ